MPQIFHPSMNTISRATIFGAVFVLALAVWVGGAIVRSPYVTNVGVIREQLVPFSHEHHVADIGIDCRYCHSSVEVSSFAGIPPTETCINCHSQIWVDAPMLAPVRESFRDDKPLVWNRVYDSPGYVYFDHSIHIHKGVACVRCHGDLGEMPLTWKATTLFMEWCLECHRDPGRFVGPRELVFASATNPAPASQLTASNWTEAYDLKRKTDCSVCHR